MSGSASLPLSALGSGATSPLEALSQWNDAQKGGLQNQQIGLQNQQLGLMLGLRGQLAGLIGVGPNGQPLPPGQAPGAMGGGGPGGMGPGGAAADPLASAGIPQVSPTAVMSPYGVPMPRAQMIAAVMSADPSKAITDAYNMGRQRLTQIMTQAGDPNDPDPAKAAQASAMVRAAAGQLYTEGWIDPRAYQTLMADPNKAAAFIRGTASPDEHMKQATTFGIHGLRADSNGNVVYDPNAAAGLATTGGQVAGVEAGAKVGPETQLAANKQQIANQSEMVTIDMPGPGGSVIPTQMTKAEAIRRGFLGQGQGGAASGGGSASAAPGVTPTKIFGALVGTEGSGPHAVSPKGARGTAQIVEGTFDQYKLPGENYANEEDRVAAAHRYIDDMWRKYPGDPARVAVGYFSGTGNIAQPGSPTPWIKDTNDGNMPVSEYVNRFSGRLGLSPTKVAANTAGVTPAATDAGGATPAEAASPQPGDHVPGTIGQTVPAPGVTGLPGQGVPKLTPQAQADLEQQKAIGTDAGKANIKQVTDYQDTLVEKTQTAQRMNNLIQQARIESQSWTSGTFADHKMAALKMWDTLKNNLNALAGKEVFGQPNPAVGDWEAFNKDMLANVSSAVREVSPRAAVQEFNTIMRTQPQDTTSPQGMRHLFDQMQGIGDWVQAKSAAAGMLNKVSGSTNKFESNWNASVTPTAFIVHRMSTDDFRDLNARLSQTKEGREMLAGIVKQMQFLNSQGLFNQDNAGLPAGRQVGQ